MTNRELDGLFATARNTPAETSVKEVTAWVGAAALATAGLGVLAKLKIIFIKKFIIMITGSIITGGIVAGVVMLSSSNTLSPEKTILPNSEKMAAIVDDSSEIEKNEEVFVFDSTVKKLKLSTAPDPFLPIAPIVPINTLPVVQPVQPVSPVKPVASKRSPARDFQTVHIDGVYNTVIKMGSTQKVEIKRNGVFTEVTDYEVNNGVFCSDCTDELNTLTEEGGDLYITVTSSLQEIHHDGVGDLESEGILKLESLRLWLNGVGETSLEIESGSFIGDFNGVGDVKIIGSSTKGEIKNNGVGNFKGYDFVFESLNVTHNGIGDVLVHATRSINIQANGVGNVCYKGEPAEKELGNNGIGKIKKK